MSEGSDGDRFLLEIVPVGENVRTARLFGASIARHFRCDEEQVEDLKLALSESVNRALHSLPEGSQAGPIRVVVVRDDDGLAFSVDAPATERDIPPDADFAPTEELIQALFPDATFNGESSTRFTVALP